jgi:hypothetical protein
VFVLLPFATSLASVWLCFHIVRQVAGERAGWIAATFQAVFPLEVIYSTHLFPDIIVGALAALAIWLWVVGLTRNSSRAFVGAGAALAAGYLCRETVLLEIPVLLVLWLYFGGVRRPRALWTALVPALVFLVEGLVYAGSTGDFLYRWHAIATHHVPAASGPGDAAAPQGLTFSRRLDAIADPLWMLATSHEFGVFHVLAMPLAVLTLLRRAELRWVALWLVTGYLWVFYGTTVPTAWVPLASDPRYASSLTIPALLILAAHLVTWRPSLRLWAVGFLIGLSLLSSGLDQRASELSAHKAYLRTEFVEDAALEPFEYYGARWVAGLRTHVAFGCAADQGRGSVADLVAALPAARLIPAGEARYFVFSPRRRRGLEQALERQGWRKVAEVLGEAPAVRRWGLSILSLIPGQEGRVRFASQAPRLVVMERPEGAGLSSSRPSSRD